MNVFYIPNVGYVFNEKIWLRFEKLVEDLYNQAESHRSNQLANLDVIVYNENDEMDRMIKQCWVSGLLYRGVKYQDA